MRLAGAPNHKLSRRFGVDIFGTGGESLARRLAVPPGGTKPGRRRRPSDYALQLQEKQNVRAIYGVSEAQFRRLYARAARRPGENGANLLQYLERRLDNVVYLLGFARNRPMARQLVNHGHVLVDGRRVDIASFQVGAGLAVTMTEGAGRIVGVVDSLAEGARCRAGWSGGSAADASSPCPTGRTSPSPSTSWPSSPSTPGNARAGAGAGAGADESGQTSEEHDLARAPE